MPDQPDFYAPISSKLSQGDIVSDVPWGLVESPVTVCRPHDPTQIPGKARYERLEKLKMPFRKTGEFIHLRAPVVGPAIVLWHDCQIDKFEEQGKSEEKWFAAVAPVVPMRNMDGDAVQAVRDGKRRAFFWMPKNAASGVPEESYADLRHILPFRQIFLMERRKGALSDTVRRALHLHLFTFFTQRAFNETVTCACGRKIEADVAFPQLSENEGAT